VEKKEKMGGKMKEALFCGPSTSSKLLLTLVIRGQKSEFLKSSGEYQRIPLRIFRLLSAKYPGNKGYVTFLP
jgi:hypothetical protein